MKKETFKIFFTKLWRGLCKVFEWFFGLFGYKREGIFAKCIWGVFATSAVIIIAIYAIGLVLPSCESFYYEVKEAYCYNPDCDYSEYISQNVYFHNHDDGKGYIFNTKTGERTISGICWIAEPNGEDSLVCFSDGKKRGYFNKKTGKIAIKPKYKHAWIFSDGLASVDENGCIKFIDSTGKVVIDKNLAYVPNMDGYVFHGGYCIVGAGDENYGLMDKTGVMVLAKEHSMINLEEDYDLWRVRKGKEMAVFDKDLKPIVPFMEGSIYINEGTIDVSMPDHTMRKYDLTGKLINDFYISSVRMLDYEKDEVLYKRTASEEYDDNEGETKQHVEMEAYHPKSTARLRAYQSDSHEGLMTADGHIVTMPLYTDIEALGYDLYLCSSTNGDKLVVNGKGEIVK